MTSPLRYDDLVDDYNSRLLTQLRGHRAPESLDLWVPDANASTSLLNMFEAAQAAQLDELSIIVGAQTAASIDLAALGAELSALGNVAVERLDSGEVVISVAGMLVMQSLLAVRPTYRRALASQLKRIAHEGRLVPEMGLLIETHRDDTTLQMLIDPDRHVVRQASFTTTTALRRAALDALCELACELPIQELSEHGVAKLEYRLRDPGASLPVRGVVTPVSADPLFGEIELMVRGIYARYRETSGYDHRPNHYTVSVSSHWLRLDDAGRRALLEPVFADVAVAATLGHDDLRVDRIERNVRIIVGFGENVAVDRKPSMMRALERELKRRVEPSLEVFAAEIRDESALRRL